MGVPPTGSGFPLQVLARKLAVGFPLQSLTHARRKDPLALHPFFSITTHGL
ncbi:MAG: hypothetical protein BWY27_00993 [Bacteroidetes bacterium ADurb.Bin234]|nr:MAG: hypothetical protein BWY27_00993 [Bacteroidetes bacterium ADurb.Bin234]